ncbi:hypothetical protein [Capnocytophaga felis]|uniref:Beta-carotene 15,15'-monooxygenase n=1 Tax=Capnocytophaga felis TaxID=2267611 RepID=A0A5M4BA05_9FLAO|nr:hypothetical protein [Capnocytophaga felis]GET46444.1 hypothetical protein RCZ01_17460 [Capnocytophaga felis]GET48333.1 hypothetical protein RCZ02_11640 [Capnocytophaga felis]
MNKVIRVNRFFLAFGIPILIYTFCYILSHQTVFQQNKNIFSNLIIFDLIIFTPVIYFFLIRNTRLSNKSSVLVFIIGIVLASHIIPAENQFFIEIAKRWGVPIIELSVMAFVFIKIFQTIKKHKAEKTSQLDFYTFSKKIFCRIAPNKIGNFLATEIALMYYAFFVWKHKKRATYQFTTHKKSSAVSTLGAFIFIILIESVSVHILVYQWNEIIAWVLTGFSIYSAIMIFGIIKSIIYRHSVVENQEITLYFGLLSEAKINIKEIDRIELISKGINQEEKSNKSLSPFSNTDGYNIVIYLKNEHQINGMYGFKRNYKILTLQLDDNEKFKELIEKNLFFL